MLFRTACGPLSFPRASRYTKALLVLLRPVHAHAILGYIETALETLWCQSALVRCCLMDHKSVQLHQSYSRALEGSVIGFFYQKWQSKWL